MKCLIFIISLFILNLTGLSQVFMDTSVMTVIENALNGSEGDMYMDTVNHIYKIGLTNGKLGYVTDNQNLDSIILLNDTSIVVYLERGGADTLSMTNLINLGWKINGNDNIDDNTNFIGTINDEDLVIKTNNQERARIDSIGNLILNQYPETRADDTSTYLNVIYTDANGYAKSGRREIIPPASYLDASILSIGNSFNYYNHYATQMTNAGLRPIPLANLDFYLLNYDPAVFNNVSISSLGVLSYDIIAVTTLKTFIDVRFYTK